MSKPAIRTSANARRKGESQTAPDAVGRGGMEASQGQGRTETLVPLSFKVPPEFKRRYQFAALESGLKLNKFLFSLLERFEAEKRKS